jgi:YggT family protein
LSALLVNFVDLISWALTAAIFGRVIMSWVSPRGNDPITAILYQITEPILGPIRRLLPQMGMFDLAPLVALLVLRYLVPRILSLLVA